MSGMDFTENVTLILPDIQEELRSFSESEYNSSHGLIIEIAAIHEGLTANYNMYTKEALEASLQSWTTPYPKPIILNHDVEVDPVGRVIGAKLDQEDDGTPYVRLQVAITDPHAIEKVSDRRYLTGSVGGKAQEALCSVCGKDWAQAGMFEQVCKHQRGKVYNGKQAYFELKNIGFREYSFVNIPADSTSGVKTIHASAEDIETDGWVTQAKVYSLDMNKESIVEFTEADGTVNVLKDMKKKDITPVYLGLKGAFLSAYSYELAEKETKESKTEKTDTTINIENHDKTPEETDMTKENETVEEEDVLALTEELSDDLASQAASGAESEEDEEATEDSDEVAEETEDSIEDETPSEESDSEEEQDTDEPVESEESDEQSEDVDEGDDTEESELSEEDNSEESPETEVAEEETEEGTDEPSEADQRVTALVEENTKLRALVKKMLAERVVDTKIAAGMLEASERETALAEHMSRSVSSLTDSIRDLSSVTFRRVEPIDLKINDRTITKPEDKVSTEGEEPIEVVDVAKALEDKFVNVLMGREKLQ